MMVISMNSNEVLFMNKFSLDYIDKKIDSEVKENDILITAEDLDKNYNTS